MPARKKLLLAAACGFTILWFAMLFGRALYDPDEGRYAEIPREMLASGDWVIPHLNGLPYLEKPPLQYWITALNFRIFGQGEGSARLWTGLCGYLSLAVMLLVAWRLWDLAAGLRALLLGAASSLFVLLGHQLTLDMALSFWLLACLACFILAQQRRQSAVAWRAWMLGSWAAMALAVLTKGLIGVVVPGATLLAYVLWQRDREALARLNLRWGLPLFALIALPWFILAARANPEFLRFFFIREHFERFLTPVELRTEPWWFFAPVLIVAVLPWLPQALRALLLGWRAEAKRGQFDVNRLLWIWAVFVLVFFSFSNAKLIPYILPAIPALAVLCADPKAAADRRQLIAGAVLSGLAGVAVLCYASAIWSTESGRALALQLRPVLSWTAAALALSALGCALLTRRSRPQAALACLCGGWFAAAVTILIGGARVEQFFSAKQIALTLGAAAAAPTAVFTVQTYAQTLPFYLQRTVTLVDYRDEFALGLRQDPGAGIDTLTQFEARWRALPRGFALMPLATRERLAAAGLPMRELAVFEDRVLVAR